MTVMVILHRQAWLAHWQVCTARRETSGLTHPMRRPIRRAGSVPLSERASSRGSA
ncbi:hypothetical protein FKP32DRAFT_1591474 [Trametes sanguinea]|nr:hypothetical protein FKP32DRAFT_1591474 [Trametes sanguinea]